MGLFYKNVYSNLIQQKFSIPSNLISNLTAFEIKFEGIENLEEESLLKSFYFFLLVFSKTPAFKNFSSRYHLGKTFYNFSVFTTFKSSYLDLLLLNILNSHLNEPDKVVFSSSIFSNNLSLSLSDLKNFYLVESNPHFFKWEKDLIINFSVYSKVTLIKKFNIYFFLIENTKSLRYNNF